jgi:hypothetical protein
MKRHMLICILKYMFMEESKEIVMLDTVDMNCLWNCFKNLHMDNHTRNLENLPIYISSLFLLSFQQMYDIFMT